MKPEEVVYYNEYSGLTELCNQANVNKGRYIDGNGKSFLTSDVAHMLYLDGKFSIPIYKPKIDVLDFLDGKPKKNPGEKVYEAVFSIEERTSTYLTIRLDESFDNTLKTLVGRIQFKKERDVCINNVSGNALIRIYDVIYLAGAEETQRLLGAFATNVGLYLFVDLNGEWETLDYSGTFINVANNELQKRILQSTERAKTDILSSNDKIMAGISEIEAEQKETKEILVKGHQELLKKMDDMASVISVYKKDAEEEIDNLFDEEQMEKIISDFSNRVVNKIGRMFSELGRKQEYYSIKKKIIAEFGNQWDKLNDISQDFLVTAEVLFTDMSSSDMPLDYSGVCILVTKAMELELKIRFYDAFKDYQEGRFPRQYEKWHYTFYRMDERKDGTRRIILIDENQFTLGSIPQVFCLYQPKGIDDETFALGKQRIEEFMVDKLSVECDKNAIWKDLKEIGSSVNRIKNNYRNPAAHIRPLDKTDAQKCFDDVVYVKKMLIQFLEKCRF